MRRPCLKIVGYFFSPLQFKPDRVRTVLFFSLPKDLEGSRHPCARTTRQCTLAINRMASDLPAHRPIARPCYNIGWDFGRLTWWIVTSNPDASFAFYIYASDLAIILESVDIIWRYIIDHTLDDSSERYQIRFLFRLAWMMIAVTWMARGLAPVSYRGWSLYSVYLEIQGYLRSLER